MVRRVVETTVCIVIAALVAVPAYSHSVARLDLSGRTFQTATLPGEVQGSAPSMRLTFTNNGQVSAFSGCAALTARVKVGRRALRFSDVQTLPGSCTGDPAGAEQNVRAALGNKVRYRLSSHDLTLTRGEQSLALKEVSNSPVRP